MRRFTRVALLACVVAAVTVPAAIAQETVPPTDIATGAATPTATSAEVLGYFNYGSTMPPGIPEDCWFEYGTTLAYGGRTEAICSGTTKATLSPLVPGTTYHYRAAASNSAGTSYGPDKVFTTLGSPPPVGTSPIAPDIGLKVASGQSLTSVLRRGVRLRLTIGGACPCTVRAKLVVSRATAKRFGIVSSTSIALTRQRYDSPQTTTLKLKLKARARRKLRRAHRLKATVRVTLIGASGQSDVASRPLRLKRGRIGLRS